MTDIKKYHNWLSDLNTDGCGFVEISNTIETDRIPQSFFDMCNYLGFTPSNMIPLILSDYMLRLEKGNSHYRNDIINRIIHSNLPNKKDIMKVIYE